MILIMLAQDGFKYIFYFLGYLQHKTARVTKYGPLIQDSLLNFYNSTQGGCFETQWTIFHPARLNNRPVGQR